MTAERIEPGVLRQRADASAVWLGQLADQMESDASRLVAAEESNLDILGRWRELIALEQPAAILKREAEITALRAAASQWAAFEKVRDHAMRDKAMSMGLEHDTGAAYCFNSMRAFCSAPDFAALAAKLDAIAEARKPKVEPEVWRWRWPAGHMGSDTYPSAVACRKIYTDHGHDGTPYRETVNPDGSILLTPEGRGDG